MLNDFLNLPTFFLCAIVAIASMGISILALVVIRKKFHLEMFQENHEVAGFLFNALGLIYAVLVAFVVYATWNDYNVASSNVNQEANQLHDLFLDSDGLPPEYRQSIRENILEYLRSVINEEWNLLSIGEANPHTKEILVALYTKYLNMKNLKTFEQQAIYNESIRRLNTLTDYRRLRILSSQMHIPAIIWTVIIIGALTSIGFSLFFGAKSLLLQSLMTGLFAMTNGLILLLILILDHPFSGDIKISNAPFQQVLAYLQKYLIEFTP